MRARRAALVVVAANVTKKDSADERPLFLDARPWCTVPVRPAHARHLSLSLWGGAALELAAFERHAALAMIGPRPVGERIAGERPLPFSAHPWCDVSAAASNAKPAGA